MHKTSNGGLTWDELSTVLTYGVSEHNNIIGIHYKHVNNIVVACSTYVGMNIGCSIDGVVTRAFETYPDPLNV